MTETIRYNRVQIILHWLIAFIVLAMIALGMFMVELPKQSELPVGEESVRAFYYLLHKSMGITVAMLIVLRIIWRLTHKAPALPDTMPAWQKRASQLVHGLLYLVMIAMPLSGYMQSIYSQYATKFWGMTLPRMAEANVTLRESYTERHEYLAYLFVALIIIHIAAAVKHKLSGTGITERMSLK